MLRRNKQDFLFICGCARSGTTALWRLLTEEKSLAIGLERFIGKLDGGFKLSQSLYSKKRFFTYKDGDTHFSALNANRYTKTYYPELIKYYENASYHGDKIPKLYNYLDKLNKKFKGSKVIFIHRNIFDVANSYEARRRLENHQWNRNYKRAIKEWNDSMKAILTYKGETEVLIVSYENLFYGKFDIGIITKFLGIDRTQLDKSIIEFRKKAKDPVKDKIDNLRPNHKKNILLNARFKAYTMLLNHDGQVRQNGEWKEL